MDKVKRFKEISDDNAELYEKKSHDYGDSFGKSYSKYGKISALTRISDKFNRLEQLILGYEPKIKEESIIDTLDDLSNYCIMFKIELEKDLKIINYEIKN